MGYAFQQWRHVFKLDPNKPLSDADLERLAHSGTDAFMIGGTDGVTLENTYELYERVRPFGVPVTLEVSQQELMIRGLDHYFIPVVLNSAHVDWIVGHHQRALQEFGAWYDESYVSGQGYVVLNPEAKVAKVTEARANLDVEEAVAYAEVGAKLFRLPSLYVEYSGRYGDPAVVEEIRLALPDVHLFYGGGIDGAETAKAMARFADTIVVGNVLYENLDAALATVSAVR